MATPVDIATSFPLLFQTVFERSTSKYWVSNEETFHLKSELIKHLPIHVFQRQKKADNTISSPQDIILNVCYEAFNNNQLLN